MTVGRLDGKVALVTGAASGIGAASARALAEAGAAVLVTDLDGPGADSVAASIVAAGGAAKAHRLDVTDESAWAEVVAAGAAAFGPVTVLHGNAGPTSGALMSRDLDVLGLDLGVWDTVLAVVLRGNVLGCRAVLPGMLAAGGGSIVVTSSIKGRVGTSLRTAYSTAKGGLEQLVRVVATGYGSHGVRCNAIAPGIIGTPGLRETAGAEYVARLEAAHLIPRLGVVEDVAAAVLYLASDESSFVTAQTLVVDGGLSAYVPALSPPVAAPVAPPAVPPVVIEESR
ncbi:SDR family NAD(P)-dependent oxidoreductase [uncultured Jatrophihabitans sp.]|uniref:SDR family NAD(P)-dependent oxidoreductase n=1 Tax=uncultured Jatrophihabitans sp. TaxID=1610747 RepID=UPI0035C9A9F6